LVPKAKSRRSRAGDPCRCGSEHQEKARVETQIRQQAGLPIP
jgi:hypothetical protein